MGMGCSGGTYRCAGDDGDFLGGHGVEWDGVE